MLSVDADANCVLDLYVNPDVAVVSLLTELTGITSEIMAERGTPLAVAMEALRAALPSNACLVRICRALGPVCGGTALERPFSQAAISFSGGSEHPKRY